MIVVHKKCPSGNSKQYCPPQQAPQLVLQGVQLLSNAFSPTSLSLASYAGSCKQGRLWPYSQPATSTLQKLFLSTGWRTQELGKCSSPHVHPHRLQTQSGCGFGKYLEVQTRYLKIKQGGERREGKETGKFKNILLSPVSH